LDRDRENAGNTNAAVSGPLLIWMKSRNWVFTLNNPESQELSILLNDNNTRCILAVLEAGECGTPHYQGVIRLKNPREMRTLKGLCPRGHFEIQRGSRKEAIEYVLKTLEREQVSGTLVATSTGDGSDIIGWTDGRLQSILPKIVATGYDGTFGELFDELSGKKKKRSLTERLVEIQAKLASGVSEEEISEEHFVEWVRYRQSFKAYKVLHQDPRNFKTEVIVIQGPTGTGKSKWCADEHPEAYWKTRDQWWCGYEGHDVVVIDEFYGWIPFDLLLRLFDRYPLQVEVKGGKVNFIAKKIFVTTNKNPRAWYKDAYFPALARRVEEWWVFGEVIRSKYKDVNEARFIELGGSQLGDINNLF